ncbi:hypothetical protein ACHAW6_007793 [Cyclotella cf. meneghiniana]
MCHYSQIMTDDGFCAYPVVKYEGIASKTSQLASSFIKTRVRSKPVFASKKNITTTASTAIIKFDLDASSDRSLGISRWKELSEGFFVVL